MQLEERQTYLLTLEKNDNNKLWDFLTGMLRPDNELLKLSLMINEQEARNCFPKKLFSQGRETDLNSEKSSQVWIDVKIFIFTRRNNWSCPVFRKLTLELLGKTLVRGAVTCCFFLFLGGHLTTVRESTTIADNVQAKRPQKFKGKKDRMVK